ncbi:MAG: hypothetical protein HYY48_03120 [Gammaproteobacteria bacterium]|nr:hypothetical protein [Gammaproteobacteria bacterium]
MDRGSTGRVQACLLGASLLLAGCGSAESRGDGPQSGDFQVRSLAKSDIGQVLEVHVREMRGHLEALMRKLYKRNPRELRKAPEATADGNVTRLLARSDNWRFPEVQDRTGVDAIHLSLAPEFTGDRVFAFVAGLASMVMAAYEYKTEFYVLDTVDAQNLYHSARNIEIAAWKLGHSVDGAGKPYLYSVSLQGEPENLSYERLFGKMIGLQDTMAVIIADRNNRTLRKVIQRMATAAFLPIL